ncbi:12070_t:CDS:2, partial [Racocetra fulgida]
AFIGGGGSGLISGGGISGGGSGLVSGRDSGGGSGGSSGLVSGRDSGGDSGESMKYVKIEVTGLKKIVILDPIKSKRAMINVDPPNKENENGLTQTHVGSRYNELLI